MATFDFKRPFKMDKLVATYQEAIDAALTNNPDCDKLVLIGCSMGSRTAVHLANMNGLPGVQRCMQHACINA